MYEMMHMKIMKTGREIREIEQGLNELNEIFRDLGTLVSEQQSMLDNIESNVINISVNVRNSADELSSASRLQKKALNRSKRKRDKTSHSNISKNRVEVEAPTPIQLLLVPATTKRCILSVGKTNPTHPVLVVAQFAASEWVVPRIINTPTF
ncbi:hypothetical protein C2G38_2226644 [Gigaspora rosea]|uniref:t-SNARE coiled-coil homology domain-containing protein n=1 Tax=Gigaspora rosea TaxID=44941 RepID=A0A397TZN3_9GLOM|nr:hypothetical protein C2G38_2226644 [Gigaspora rosea]